MRQTIDANRYDIQGGSSFIHWNPFNPDGGENVLGETLRPYYIGLGHELFHIEDYWNGTLDYNLWYIDEETNSYIPNAELNAIKFENKLRQESGIPLRRTDKY